ncbi:flagellar hook-length control protein FliK [Cribrihabitans sp. XS_ASV171]
MSDPARSDDADWPLHAVDRAPPSSGHDPVATGDRFQTAAPTTRADMARHAAVQISSAVAGGGDTVDIALNPEELGRVRMSIVTREDSILLHLGADRPETLELMRRHINELSSAFREIGYGSVQFTFGDSSAGTGEGSAGREPEKTEIRTEAPLDDIPDRPAGAVSGLDMRI